MSDKSHKNSHTIAFPGSVSIIGQTVKVHGWVPTVMMSCRCTAAPEPLMLIGLSAVAQCPACQNHYAITGITFDVRQGSGELSVGRVTVNQAPAQ